MPGPMTRRRFLSMSAAVGICAASSQAPVARWTGYAMAAPARMELSGLSETEARPIFRAVTHEVARLERIFSLHAQGSQIVQLNRTGILKAPAPELTEVLNLCDHLHAISGGAFDPTVQPLWLAMASGDRDGRARARALTGWQYLHRSDGELRLNGRGRALTLNGVAQGYVTDRIAALLRARGLGNVMIDMGEIAVLGPQRRQAGIADPAGKMVARVALMDRALATSAPFGTMIGADTGHILDPRNSDARPRHALVSISAPTAAMADGLSTMACMLPKDQIASCLSRTEGARLEVLI